MIKKKIIAVTFFVFISLLSFAQWLKLPPDTVTAPTVDLYDTTTNSFPVIISKISIAGNKITKDRIVLRELFFKENDTIAPGELKEKLIRSRQNLLNSSLFNFATISYVLNDNRAEVSIFLVERWYTIPIPLFELADPNFNTWWLTKDFSRTYYGIYLLRENFRGLKESLRLKVQFGYAEQFAIQYNAPYINKKQTIGLGFTVSHSRNKEITYKTIANKRIFYHDFGKYVKDDFYATTQLTIRNNIYNTHGFQLKYNGISIDDTISRISSDYLNNNSLKANVLMFGYDFVRDKSDYKFYPLSGYYSELELVKYGSGIFKQEPNFVYFTTRLKKFWKLSPTWFYAASASAKHSFAGQQPYFLQKGLGYLDNVRAYEYYVVDGQSWFVAKTNLKYRLISPKVQKVNVFNTSKINTLHYAVYLNFFADAGYVKDSYYKNTNALSNSWLFGYGIGLDYVTYYDKTLRFEYSINRMGQGGFFINIQAPI